MFRRVASRASAHARSHPGRRELALFAVAYLTYFGVRAATEGQAAAAYRNARRVIDFERGAGLAREGAVQSVVLGSHALSDAANAVYIYGHWPVLLIAGVLLFHFRRDQYRVLRNACLISGLIGLVVFAAFPVAPPRLTDLPLVDTVTQGSSGYRQIVPRTLVNEYAAMPSFHVGWNLLVGIVLFRATRHVAVRTFAVVMPAAMAFAVVATANHFVVDVLAGVAIVLLALALATLAERRRSRLTMGRDGPSLPDRASRGERPRVPALR